ncbi:fructose-bisphosphatase class II [Pectobacterium brasiliense]
MRIMLNLVIINCQIVIGEVDIDEAPMFVFVEQVGTCQGDAVVAVFPF